MIVLSLCLSDIDKKFVKTGKNGKSYVNLIVNRRSKQSEYGETHTLAISKTKEERELDNKTIYVGSGRGYYEDAIADNVLDALTGNNEVTDAVADEKTDGDLPF